MFHEQKSGFQVAADSVTQAGTIERNAFVPHLQAPVDGEVMMYNNNPPTYTKLDASGNDLPDNAQKWAMVRENVSGLIWEAKTDDDGIHDKDNQYLWSDVAGQFIDQLDMDTFGGYSDWRLPDIKELTMILQKEKKDSPRINRVYFPNTIPDDYWPKTSFRRDSTYFIANSKFGLSRPLVFPQVLIV